MTLIKVIQLSEDDVKLDGQPFMSLNSGSVASMLLD